MFKTALPCVGSMDLTVAREWLVRQHYRPWKIAMGIVTPRTHASKRGGALTKWTEDKHGWTEYRDAGWQWTGLETGYLSGGRKCQGSGPVSSVARELEGERGIECRERRFSKTPRLFSLLLFFFRFLFPSSSSLSSLLSIWV